MKHWQHAAAITAMAALSIGALSGCAPQKSSESSEQKTTEIVTDISKLPKQTLTVWDQESRGGQNEQIEKLNKKFQEKYPNITIKRVSKSYDDLTTTLALALSGKDGPDVAQTDNARSMMGKFVSAKQLVSLEPWSKAYGWEKNYSKDILGYARYSANGKDFGTGNLYGLPQVGESVGIYYAPSELKKYGLEPPKTWEDFNKALKTIKDKGGTPLMLGNVEQWPGIHVWGVVEGASEKADTIRTLGFGNKGASWKTEGNKKAAETLANWAKSGYFNEGYNGLDYDSVWQSFSKKEGVFLIAGSWLAPDLKAAMKDDVKFILPPKSENMDKIQTTGGTGLPFTISTKAKDKNVAAAYIDFITNQDAMKVLSETGNVPINNTASYLGDKTDITADVLKAFEELTTKGNVLPYMNYASPTMDKDLGAALQSLLASETTPEKFIETMDAHYNKAIQR